MKIFKKSGENKNTLRTIYPENLVNLRAGSLSSNFIGSYKENEIYTWFLLKSDLKLVIWYEVQDSNLLQALAGEIVYYLADHIGLIFSRWFHANLK